MELKVYRVPKIEKPFDKEEIGKFTEKELERVKPKAGDIGIYDKHVIFARKRKAVMRVETPFGITYANPSKLVKSKRYIYRYYLRAEPMMLYILTPEYNNRDKFLPKSLPDQTNKGLKTTFKAMSSIKHKLK